MELHTLQGSPSEVRRRLSGVLTADVEEPAEVVANRRRSSVRGLDDVAEIVTQKEGATLSRSRRASVVTNFFAKSSTCCDYQEKSIRPTLVIAMIHLRDPEPDVGKLRSILSGRLLEIPRFCSVFRQEKKEVFFDQLPREAIDLEHHIQVKDGMGKFGEKETSELISSSCLEWWDVKKPLWQITLVTNMKDGRSMLFCNMDHAVGDGVALASVLLSLLDDPPKDIKSLQQRRDEKPTVGISQRVVDYAFGVYYGCVGWAFTGFDPHNGLKIPRDKELSEFGHKFFSRVKPIPLDKIKTMKTKLVGTTVNDVILAVLTIAMRTYFEKTDDPVLDELLVGKDLHMNFVVNTRVSASSSEKVINLGNDFQVANLPLPLQHSSNIDAVWQSKALIDFLKMSPALFLLKNVITTILGVLPEEALITAAIDNSFKPTCFVTNVMGPSFEATIAGLAVDDLNYLASANIGLYFGILSYNNKINISFTTDRLAQIDCSLLKICIEQAYEDLEKAISDASPDELKNPNIKSRGARILEVVAPYVTVALLSCLYKAFSK